MDAKNVHEEVNVIEENRNNDASSFSAGNKVDVGDKNETSNHCDDMFEVTSNVNLEGKTKRFLRNVIQQLKANDKVNSAAATAVVEPYHQIEHLADDVVYAMIAPVTEYVSPMFPQQQRQWTCMQRPHFSSAVKNVDHEALWPDLLNVVLPIWSAHVELFINWLRRVHWEQIFVIW